MLSQPLPWVRKSSSRTPSTVYNGKVGTVLPPILVDVKSFRHQIIRTDTSSVTLSIAFGPVGGVLGGADTVSAVKGVATFGHITLSEAGSYILIATDNGVTIQTQRITIK